MRKYLWLKISCVAFVGWLFTLPFLNMGLSTTFAFMVVGPMLWVLFKEWRELYLLFALCIPAYAAPFPVVKRPAPLLSPKAASAPKVTAMRKLTTTSTEYPISTMVCTFTRDINILHCDTNSADCFFYDQTHVSTVQLAGHSLVISMTDAVGSGSWTEVGSYPAAPFDRESGFDWFQPAYDRTPLKVFREQQTIAPTGLVPASSAPRKNPALKRLELWTRPK